MSAAAPTPRQYAGLAPGDPAPWFRQRSAGNPRYAFDTAAGRYLVLCFFISAGDPASRTNIDAALARKDLFDDTRASFFGVTIDPRDESEARVRDQVPGFRFLWDFDGTVSRLYGAIPHDSAAGEQQLPARRLWVVLDPTLRVMAVFPFARDGSERSRVFTFLERLPPPAHFPGFEVHAPVLVLPNIFEFDFCKRLIDLYAADGGEETGFMREVGGKTVAMHDYSHKRRRDYLIADPAIIEQTRARIRRRIAPEIQKVHQFAVTRMERYIVCCYSAEDGGHFRAHRDNTTRGTAHRRFAVSINLNDDFDGGEVSFPEYGPRGFKPPPGGAVVFSCSLLHAVSRVTRGRRYAFLPFLYDDAAAEIRKANNVHLGAEVDAYRGMDADE